MASLEDQIRWLCWGLCTSAMLLARDLALPEFVSRLRILSASKDHSP